MAESNPKPPSSAGKPGEAIATRPGNLRLLVVVGEMVTTHALPDSGEVTIGRSAESTIAVQEESVAPAHVVVRLGSSITIEDLGSVEGTLVRGQLLEPHKPVELALDEVAVLGSATVIVQRRSNVGRPRRIWQHGYFEARVEEECARAERGRSQFALMRVHAIGEIAPHAVEEALARTIRAADVVAAADGDRIWEVLIVNATPAVADRVLARFATQTADYAGRLRVGVGCYPQDGRGFEALIARADATARGEAALEEARGQVTIAGTAMQRLQEVAERVAKSDINILILGETGVGKEVLAAALHRASHRVEKPFLRLNCAALSETLLESELFGHERGAFTGAVQSKSGLLEVAQGGTVFFDEVGDLPPSVQVKLLRVIEERKVMRVGGLQARPIDVRFVAATNRDLEADVKRSMFRQDLYFRLDGISLLIPPLRERVGEIEPLARAFVDQACQRMSRPRKPVLTDETLALLRSYSWPGNIRELRNVIERAVLLCSGDEISPANLPTEKMSAVFVDPKRAPPPPAPAAAAGEPPSPLVDETAHLAAGQRPVAWASEAPASGAFKAVRREVEAIERARIVEALNRCAGNQTGAAQLLGISRSTLLHRLKRYGLPRPRKGHKAEPAVQVPKAKLPE